MNPFNKTEAVALFASVVVMALALSLIRFKTDILTERTESRTLAAVVVGSQSGAAGDEELEDALKTSLSPQGKLTRLIIDDVILGSGDAVEPGDTLTVHYIGETQDRITFANSYEQGEPFSFTIGEGRVIKGWEEGLLGMKVGGHRVLVIPAEWAYGNRRAGVIPPNTSLIFVIELLEIK